MGSSQPLPEGALRPDPPLDRTLPLRSESDGQHDLNMARTSLHDLQHDLGAWILQEAVPDPFSTGLWARLAPGHPASPSEASPAHGNCTKWNPKWTSGWNIVPNTKACRGDLGICVSVPKPFLGVSFVCTNFIQHPEGHDIVQLSLKLLLYHALTWKCT